MVILWWQEEDVRPVGAVEMGIVVIPELEVKARPQNFGVEVYFPQEICLWILSVILKFFYCFPSL